MNKGRPKHKVYEYDKDGKYLRTHESVKEFGGMYGLEKNVAHRRNEVKGVFYEFPDGRVASRKKIGRVGVQEFKQYSRSPFVGTPKSHHLSRGNSYKYELYDLDGDIMAVFQSEWHLELLTGIHVSNKFARKDEDSVKMRNGIVVKRYK